VDPYYWKQLPYFCTSVAKKKNPCSGVTLGSSRLLEEEEEEERRRRMRGAGEEEERRISICILLINLLYLFVSFKVILVHKPRFHNLFSHGNLV